MPVDLEDTTRDGSDRQSGLLLDKVKTYLRIIIEPTMTSAPPVAQEGIDAKMGAKKTETKNMKPTTTAVIPVLPPSAKYSLQCNVRKSDLDPNIPLIPVALSMYAVTGLTPSRAPMLMENASMQ